MFIENLNNQKVCINKWLRDLNVKKSLIENPYNERRRVQCQ